MSHIDTELLSSFVAIVEGGGFTRAAERLHKTQSTISHQLKRLEQRLGVDLLQRNTRQMQLTEQGELLLGYAKRMLEVERQTLEAMTRTKITGRVRFGCIQDVADQGLSEVLSHFSRLYPEVRLEVKVEANCNLRQLLERGELDLAVVYQDVGSGGMVIDQFERVWACREDFVIPEKGPLPLVLFESTCCMFRTAAIEALEGASIDWQIVFSTPSLAGLRAAVRAGLGVSVRTRKWLESDLRSVSPDILPNLPPFELAIHKSSAKPEEAVERLLETIQQVLR